VIDLLRSVLAILASPFRPDASVADYRKLQRRLGLTRNVVVQPSTYGTDNSLLVESVKAFRGNARGIAMLDATVTNDELSRLHAAGIRGVRFGTRLPGGASIDQMTPVHVANQIRT
jgi:predicted TIM-barrel fold metal-dependent hydrolase